VSSVHSVKGFDEIHEQCPLVSHVTSSLKCARSTKKSVLTPSAFATIVFLDAAFRGFFEQSPLRVAPIIPRSSHVFEADAPPVGRG
jgi:hypothetical protein